MIRSKNDDIVIEFTPETLKRLVRSRNRAIDEGKEEFVFEGMALLVSYSFYLIMHLCNKFGYSVEGVDSMKIASIKKRKP